MDAILEVLSVKEPAKVSRIRYQKDTYRETKGLLEKIRRQKAANDLAFTDAYITIPVGSSLPLDTGFSCIQGDYLPDLVV